MDINEKDVEKLIGMLRTALAMLEGKVHTPVEPSAEVQAEVNRKLEAGICLAWDHKIEDGQRVIRGQCQTDYNTTMARIRRGEENETDLIMQGKLLAEGKRAGRRAARDVAADKAAKQLRVAEDANRYKKKQPKQGSE